MKYLIQAFYQTGDSFQSNVLQLQKFVIIYNLKTV